MKNKLLFWILGSSLLLAVSSCNQKSYSDDESDTEMSASDDDSGEAPTQWSGPGRYYGQYFDDQDTYYNYYYYTYYPEYYGRPYSGNFWWGWSGGDGWHGWHGHHWHSDRHDRHDHGGRHNRHDHHGAHGSKHGGHRH